MGSRSRYGGKTSGDQDIELTNTANNGNVEMHPRYKNLPRYNHVRDY